VAQSPWLSRSAGQRDSPPGTPPGTSGLPVENVIKYNAGKMSIWNQVSDWRVLMKTLEDLRQDITSFRDERNWKKFHNPKDLAIAISIEAAELLEVFQWSGEDLLVDSKRDRVEEELADVLIYCGLMADAMGMMSRR